MLRIFHRDFGTATMKVWQTVMAMRGESKQVTDALYDVIMGGWRPTPVTPLNPATFQVPSLSTTHKCKHLFQLSHL